MPGDNILMTDNAPIISDADLKEIAQINRKVRDLFGRNKSKIKYDKHGVFTITDDGRSFMPHALSIDGEDVRLIIETDEILYHGTACPMDEETKRFVADCMSDVNNKKIQEAIATSIDTTTANRIAHRLAKKYISAEFSDSSSLIYSSKEISLLKKIFPYVDDAIVNLLINKEKIIMGFYDKNNTLLCSQEYPMDQKTIKSAKNAAQIDPKLRSRSKDDAFIMAVVCAVFGGFVCTITGFIIADNTPHKRKMRAQYEEFKSTLPNYADSMRVAQTPEEFARFKTLKGFDEQRLANYWEELKKQK